MFLRNLFAGVFLIFFSLTAVSFVMLWQWRAHVLQQDKVVTSLANSGVYAKIADGVNTLIHDNTPKDADVSKLGLDVTEQQVSRLVSDALVGAFGMWENPGVEKFEVSLLPLSPAARVFLCDQNQGLIATSCVWKTAPITVDNVLKAKDPATFALDANPVVVFSGGAWTVFGVLYRSLATVLVVVGIVAVVWLLLGMLLSEPHRRWNFVGWSFVAGFGATGIVGWGMKLALDFPIEIAIGGGSDFPKILGPLVRSLFGDFAAGVAWTGVIGFVVGVVLLIVLAVLRRRGVMHDGPMNADGPAPHNGHHGAAPHHTPHGEHTPKQHAL